MNIGTIVLVDDSEADNVFHELMLRRAGFTGELLQFEGGEAALGYLRNRSNEDSTCLILLDINMPGMNGWDFAAAASSLIAVKPWMVVVMLTSSGAEQDLARAQGMPEIRGYLTKPLTVERATELLRGQLSSDRAD